jgi:prepilin-type N-terminal cleavage/methylation domain-containing protein
MSPVPVPAPRAFTLVEIMVVVVIIGLLAALAIPGFQKVHLASQDKAVLSNARLLAGAADQYMMQQGVTAVNLTDLVGTPVAIGFTAGSAARGLADISDDDLVDDALATLGSLRP